MKRFLGAALAVALWAGCGEGGGGVSAPVDIVVATSDPDSFSIAAVGFAISGTRTYTWSCSKGQADLTIGSVLVQGSVRLEVFDAASSLVHDNTYSATLLGDVSTVTKSGGAPGDWTLRFTFDNALFSGAITLTAHLQGQPDLIDVGGTDSLNASWIFQPGWTANPVHVDVGGISTGSVRIRLWDGTQKLVLDQTVLGLTAFTQDVTGAAGVWTVQLDFTNAAVVGAVSLSQT